MKLILAGASPSASVAWVNLLKQVIDPSLKALYLPVALPSFQVEAEEYKEFTTLCNLIGVKGIDVRVDLENITSEDLKEYGFLYIEDGNAFTLLRRMKESEFVQKLVIYMKGEGCVCGAGAGAMIFGKTITPALHTNFMPPLYKDINGLNFVKDYDIWCHYQEEKDKGFIDAYNGKLIILSDESLAFLHQNKMVLLGPDCMIYQKHHPTIEKCDPSFS